MSQIIEQQLVQQIPEIISAWFEGEKGDVIFEKNTQIDLIHKISNYVFLIELKKSGNISQISSAVNSLKRSLVQINEPQAIPLIAVPFMGEKGKELCAKEKISWLDLSGNADIKATNLRILIEGKPNLFKLKGRPKDLFATKSSRIARNFLIDPHLVMTQRELTEKTKLNETLVGRVVKEFLREDILSKDKTTGKVWLKNPEILLDSWVENYQFDKHHIIRGFIPQRGGEATMRKIVEVLENNNIEYAASGLAGAWLLTKFANFRLTTFYLKDVPAESIFKELSFSQQSQTGANTWFIIPNDESIFLGMNKYEGINCVHPLQVYLDLKAHPERANEAAQEIRKAYLNWGINES
jgi:Transcriptional regulator, AbiEi antitoxin, Type IV TA system